MILILFSVTNVSAQDVLREKKIKKKNVPKQIIEKFHSTYPNVDKIRFYQTTYENDSVLFEMKFSDDKKVRINMIFSSSAQLVKIERSIHYSNVPHKAKILINKDLSLRFSHFKIDHCLEGKSNQKIEYKVILKGKTTTFFKDYIFFYDTGGKYISHQEIPPKNIDQIFH